MKAYPFLWGLAGGFTGTAIAVIIVTLWHPGDVASFALGFGGGLGGYLIGWSLGLRKMLA